MRFILYLFFSIIMVASVFAQNLNRQSQLDSLKNKLSADSAHTYRFKKYRPYFAFDNRRSFIRETPVNFRGLQFGLIFKQRHTMGLGIYRILQSSTRPVKSRDKDNFLVTQYLNLNYSTFFYEFTIINKHYFKIDLPLEIGIGRARISLVDSITQTVVKNDEIGIIPIGTGLQFVLKPFKWIGLSTMGGYRYVSEKGRNINFNGFYYSIGVWLDLRQIYRDVKFYGFQRRKYLRELKKLPVY